MGVFQEQNALPARGAPAANEPNAPAGANAQQAYPQTSQAFIEERYLFDHSAVALRFLASIDLRTGRVEKAVVVGPGVSSKI